MTTFLPMFPLQMVVFPSEHLNLHIFEPRYRQLVNECFEEDKSFGMPAFIDNKIMEYGTELKILDIEKTYEDGKMDIRTLGIGRFYIEKYHRSVPDKLYSGADVETILDNSKGDWDLNEEILELSLELFDILKIKKSLPSNSPAFTTYKIAHHVGFNIEQEYAYFTLRSEQERQMYMMAHLKKLIPIVREMEELRKKIQLNGHFKNIIPPNV